VSRTTRPRRVGTALAVTLAGALVLIGCSAGQLAPTAQQVGNSGGADASAGEVLIRDARIVFEGPVEGADAYPAGSSAPLATSIVNTGAAADRLLSASSPHAASVALGGTLEIPGGQALVVTGEPAPPGESEEGQATATPTPTATDEADGDAGAATAEPTPTATAGPRTAQITLTGLREPLRHGRTYEVVLVFERAGEVRVPVPVQLPDAPREDEPAAE
jgi:periplasmic copper chaperone A